MVKTCVELLDNAGFNNLVVDDRFIQYVKGSTLVSDQYNYYTVTAAPDGNNVVYTNKKGNNVTIAFDAGPIFKISTTDAVAAVVANADVPDAADDNGAAAAAREQERVPLDAAVTAARAALVPLEAVVVTATDAFDNRADDADLDNLTATRDEAIANRDAAQPALNDAQAALTEFDNAGAAGGGKRRKSAKKGRKPSKRGRKSAKRGRRGKGSRRNKK